MALREEAAMPEDDRFRSAELGCHLEAAGETLRAIRELIEQEAFRVFLEGRPSARIPAARDRAAPPPTALI